MLTGQVGTGGGTAVVVGIEVVVRTAVVVNWPIQSVDVRANVPVVGIAL